MPPAWSIGLLLPLILVVSAMASAAWQHWAGVLGLPKAIADRGTFLVVELLGILLPALTVAHLLKLSPREVFPFRRVSPGPVLAVFAATLGLSTVLTYLQEIYQDAFKLPYPEALLEVLTIHSPLEGLLLVAGVVGAAALCEEIVFRGYVQSALQQRSSAGLAILATAVLFALFHLEPAGLPTYLTLGLWLSWLRMASGALWLPVLAHATNNLLALVQANVLGEAFWRDHALLLLPLALVLLAAGGVATWRGLKAA